MDKKEKIVQLMNKRMDLMKAGKTLEEIEVLKECGDLILEVYGEESDENIKILNEIGGTLKYVNAFEEAEKALITAKNLIEKKYGKNNISYATCNLNLAEVYRYMKKFDETEKIYLDTMKIYEINNLQNDYLYAGLCNNLGLFYQELGKYEKALPLHEKSLKILENSKEHSLQYATTLSNLVSPYSKLGNKEKSEYCLNKSLELIEKEVGKKHSLYSASLNNLAIHCFNEGNFEKALILFEESLGICKEAFGENSNNYKALLSNVQFVKETINKKEKVQREKIEENSQCGKNVENFKKENIKGMELSKKYFYEIYLPNIKKQFPDLFEKMAFGLVGEGSECLGYDDEISKDHDFGPSCCIWLLDEDYKKYGIELQKYIDTLPKDFMGYNGVNVSEWGDNRRGVLNINDWYYKFLGKEKEPITLEEWRIIPETALATATNGEVFLDNLGEFSRIRNILKKYYPEDIRKNKIATRCMKIAQSGQYNYNRLMKRNDIVASKIAETEFINEVIHMIYLLNKKYLLFYKWAYKGLKELSILGEEIYRKIGDFVERPIYDINGKVHIIEEICQLIIRELKKQNLVDNKINSDFLLDYGPLVQNKIEDEKLRKWSPWLD